MHLSFQAKALLDAQRRTLMKNITKAKLEPLLAIDREANFTDRFPAPMMWLTYPRHIDF